MKKVREEPLRVRVFGIALEKGALVTPELLGSGVTIGAYGVLSKLAGQPLRGLIRLLQIEALLLRRRPGLEFKCRDAPFQRVDPPCQPQDLGELRSIRASRDDRSHSQLREARALDQNLLRLRQGTC